MMGLRAMTNVSKVIESVWLFFATRISASTD
jgi:hypothetical protein